MKNLRLILSTSVVAFLVLGYAASQLAVFQGNALTYAQKIDCPQVQWLALFFLLISIVFAFIKDPEANEK
jgi:hypothetical protein